MCPSLNTLTGPASALAGCTGQTCVLNSALLTKSTLTTKPL